MTPPNPYPTKSHQSKVNAFDHLGKRISKTKEKNNTAITVSKIEKEYDFLFLKNHLLSAKIKPNKIGILKKGSNQLSKKGIEMCNIFCRN